MFKNFGVKIFSVALAAMFWVLVVSLENAFSKLPEPVEVQVFNLAEGLALQDKPVSVEFVVRAQDPGLLRSLAPGDFEAYVDLSNVGAGTHRVPVAVTSRVAQVTVVRAEPSEVSLTLEPVREKLVPLKLVLEGSPLPGFRLESSKLSRENVRISGAESKLKKITQARARLTLNGTERESASAVPEVVLLDSRGAPVSGIKILDTDMSVSLVIAQAEATKLVGVRPSLTGTIVDGVISHIEVSPSVLLITGKTEVIDAVTELATEPVDLVGISADFEKKTTVVLPLGVSLAAGEPREITVKATITKTLPSL